MGFEKLLLAGGLDTLAGDRQPQRMGHEDDGPGHRPGVEVLDVLHERAVDFQGLDGEMPEPAERRVPGAEVVDGQPDAQSGQRAQDLGGGGARDGSGGGDGNSAVTLSNFAFGGGTADGALALNGGASGSLASGATLTDSTFFNEFYQNFYAGSVLSFQLGLDLGDDVAADSNAAPDLFTLALFDVAGTGVELPTLDPDLNRAVLSFQFGDLSPLSFATDSNQLSVPAADVATVPEPASVLLLGTGLAFGVVRWRRRRTAVSA